MQINNPTNTVAPNNAAVQKSVTSNHQGTAEKASTDTLTLTDTALINNGKLQAAITEASVVDQTRVDQIKAALESGSYTINADRVADKMLHFENAVQ